MVYRNYLLVQKVHINGVIQKALLLSLLERVLDESHHPPTTRHPGKFSIYEAHRKPFCCTHMAAGVAYVVQNCTRWAPNNPKYYHWRKMRSFLSSGSLDFVALDTVNQHLVNRHGNNYIVAFTNRYFKANVSSTAIKDDCHACCETSEGSLAHS